MKRKTQEKKKRLHPVLETFLGRLYQGDCLAVLKELPAESVDLTFADPPFNLGKLYSSKMDDAISPEKYFEWYKSWTTELIRVLKPGGSLFLYNLPKWNLMLGSLLFEKMTFRNWIAIDMKYSLPISGRLYPAHYSLLYFVKGKKPTIFHPDRLPIKTCRHCGGEIRDYGGYKNKMNPLGVNLTDIWDDIPPVRHQKYKKRKSNELSLKLMDRIISMASDRGSVVLDPFGGAGTSFVAAELLGRKWIGIELECSAIINRFKRIDEDRSYITALHGKKNTLFTDATLSLRKKSGIRTDQYRVSNGKPPQALTVP